MQQPVTQSESYLAAEGTVRKRVLDWNTARELYVCLGHIREPSSWSYTAARGIVRAPFSSLEYPPVRGQVK